MNKKRLPILLLSIILLAAFLRLFVLDETPLGLYPDEAMNGNNALEALETGKFKIFYPENNGREGLFINIQAISIWLFGNEPWALRVVSALFGTLTILGVYLVTKELFKEKSQAPSSKSQPSSNNQNFNNQTKRVWNLKNWSLFGNWGLETGISRSQTIALLSSFFLATSYWHINFSRIGFRAIMVPFFATFGMYFLLKGLRRKKMLDLVWAGIFIGLGFHTYIAFRFMPFVLAVPILWYLWPRWKERNYGISGSPTSKNCTLCAIALFLFIVFMVALPIGWYFLQNPQDFLGRGGQVSIFSADSPLKEFVKSSLQTFGMFFWKGDCNWRHNYACSPQLHPLAAFFFTIGLIVAIKNILTAARNFQFSIFNFQSSPNDQNSKRFENWELNIENSQAKLPFYILLVWLILMSLPATLTKEGLPHALRSISMIPPVMMLTGFGAWLTITKLVAWLEKAKRTFPEIQKKIARIQREAIFLFIVLLVIIPTKTYIDYFVSWAFKPETYFAFSTDILHLGQFLDSKPGTIKKYVIVNLDGVEVREIPMPAQTVMFATDSFTESKQKEKNIFYLVPKDINSISAPPEQKTIITLIEGDDRNLIRTLKEKFPHLKPIAAQDFIVFENK